MCTSGTYDLLAALAIVTLTEGDWTACEVPPPHGEDPYTQSRRVTPWSLAAMPGMLLSVCVFVYVAADHPLEAASDGSLQLTRLKRRERKHLPDGEHVYLALGCACALTLDGADEEDKAERNRLLDDLEAFLVAATETGDVRALVTDGSRMPPKEVAVSATEFREFDFDSAWDAPTLLTVRRG